MAARTLLRLRLAIPTLLTALALLPLPASAAGPDDEYWDWPAGQCVDRRFVPGYGFTVQQDYANLRPFESRCTQQPMTNFCYHAGLDIYRNDQNSFGEPVFAAADGRVVAIIDWGTQGLGVLVQHQAIYSQYLHLLPASVAVQQGEPVRRGQFVGSIMNYPDGPDHVHFEVRPDLRVRYCPNPGDVPDKRCPLEPENNPESCRGNGYSLSPTRADNGERNLADWGFTDPADAYFRNRPPYPTQIIADQQVNIRDAASTSGADIGDLLPGNWLTATRPTLIRSGGLVSEAWYPVTFGGVSGYSRAFGYTGWGADMLISEAVREGREWQPPRSSPIVDARFGDDCPQVGNDQTPVCQRSNTAVSNYAPGGGAGFLHGTFNLPPAYSGMHSYFCDLVAAPTAGSYATFDMPAGINFRNGIAVELSVEVGDLGAGGREVIAAQGPAGSETWTLSLEPGVVGQRQLRFEVRLADASTRRVSMLLPEPSCDPFPADQCDRTEDGRKSETIYKPECSAVPPACNPDLVAAGCVSDFGYRGWHHIAARADRRSGVLELFWDGRRVASDALPLSLTAAAGPIRAGEGLNGKLDNLLVWATSGVVELDPDPVGVPSPTVVEGTPVTFTTAIHNRGNADSGPFLVGWWLDGAAVASGLHPNVPPGGAVQAAVDLLPWTATQPPTHHTVFFYADTDGRVAERNERNNDASGAIDVDPAVPCTGIRGVCEPTPTLRTHPDLHPVSIVIDQGELLEGRQLVLGSVVENRGYVVAGPFSAIWQVDGVTATPLLPHVGIAPRSSTRDHAIDFTWKALAGRHRLLVWLDPSGAITEANENNNRRALSVDVVPAPDLHPTPIVFDQEAAAAGEPVFLDVAVENLGSVASGGFNVRWLIDGVEVAAGFHASVPAHATVANGNSQLTWTFPPGPHEVAFEVDYSGFVEEGDETNNVAEASVGGGLAIVRVDTDPVAIAGQKELDKLFDGLTWWPHTAIIHFVQNTPVGVQMEFAAPQTLEAFRVSVAGVDFGGSGVGTYRFDVDTAASWDGPFSRVLTGYEIDDRIEIATVRLPAPTTARVFKVTATRANGDGVVHWLELEPIPSLAAAGYPYGLTRVDTEPVAISGQKDLPKLLDGVVNWPNTAIVHFVANADVAVRLEFPEPTLLSGFWTSVAGTDFGSGGAGTYAWKVEAGNAWDGPFTTLLDGFTTDSRDGLVELPFSASVLAKVYRVTANRTNGDGVVHWLELGPQILHP